MIQFHINEVDEAEIISDLMPITDEANERDLALTKMTDIIILRNTYKHEINIIMPQVGPGYFSSDMKLCWLFIENDVRRKAAVTKNGKA